MVNAMGLKAAERLRRTNRDGLSHHGLASGHGATLKTEPKQQLMQNVATHVLMQDVLWELHWLPIPFHAHFKILGHPFSAFPEAEHSTFAS